MPGEGYKTDAEELAAFVGDDPTDPFVQAVALAARLGDREREQIRASRDYTDALAVCQERARDLHEAFLHDTAAGRDWLTEQVHAADRELAAVFVRLATTRVASAAEPATSEDALAKARRALGNT